MRLSKKYLLSKKFNDFYILLLIYTYALFKFYIKLGEVKRGVQTRYRPGMLVKSTKHLNLNLRYQLCYNTFFMSQILAKSLYLSPFYSIKPKKHKQKYLLFNSMRGYYLMHLHNTNVFKGVFYIPLLRINTKVLNSCYSYYTTIMRNYMYLSSSYQSLFTYIVQSFKQFFIGGLYTEPLTKVIPLIRRLVVMLDNYKSQKFLFIQYIEIIFQIVYLIFSSNSSLDYQNSYLVVKKVTTHRELLNFYLKLYKYSAISITNKKLFSYPLIGKALYIKLLYFIGYSIKYYFVQPFFNFLPKGIKLKHFKWQRLVSNYVYGHFSFSRNLINNQNFYKYSFSRYLDINHSCLRFKEVDNKLNPIPQLFKIVNYKWGRFAYKYNSCIKKLYGDRILAKPEYQSLILPQGSMYIYILSNYGYYKYRGFYRGTLKRSKVYARHTLANKLRRFLHINIKLNAYF